MNGKILSYSAGSTSRDPYKFRVISDTGSANESGPPSKMRRLIETFSELPRFFMDHANTLVIDGYPAALGGLDSMTRVVTYLHPPTCTRAFELAALEGWRSIFVAQPLAGAHLLLSALEQEIRWPQEVLWATGGYPLPASLENFIREVLADQGCRLSVMQAYGIAELDHTLLAATERDADGRPIYYQIDDELDLSPEGTGQVDESVAFASLGYRGKRFPNHDQITAVGSTYRIGGDANRYSDQVLNWLESWQLSDWDQFTGYLTGYRSGDEQCVILQRRHCPSVAGSIGTIAYRLSETSLGEIPDGCAISELNHFKYIERYGMSWLEKPKWNDETIKLHGLRVEGHGVAAAA